jgi:hypothetical protein
VRVEDLDGSLIGTGWALFHRFCWIDEAEYAEWDGYIEVVKASADFDPKWHTKPCRVVPSPEGPKGLPSIVVLARMDRALGDGRVGVLVHEVDEEPVAQDAARWPTRP